MFPDALFDSPQFRTSAASTKPKAKAVMQYAVAVFIVVALYAALVVVSVVSWG